MSQQEQGIQLSNLNSSVQDVTTTVPAAATVNNVPSQNHPRAETQRLFKRRHVTMDAIGGAVGTGLVIYTLPPSNLLRLDFGHSAIGGSEALTSISLQMIGTGIALSKAGVGSLQGQIQDTAGSNHLQPAALVISYTLVGLIVFLVLCALGEMATWLPVTQTFTGHAVRFCDPALGFTLGWIYWLKFVISTPNQLIASALVVAYWLSPDYVDPGAWITIFLVAIVLANCFAVGYHIRFEFWLSSSKVFIIVFLLVLSIVLAAGGGPDGEAKGFRYWKDPGAFVIMTGTGKEHVARLAAVWKTLPSATFAYLGTELVGMNIPQSGGSRKSTKRAIKLIFYRILVFDIMAATLVGMLVPHDSRHLAFSSDAAESAAASAFVAAIQIAGIAVLPHILNACILLFVVAAANNSLFMATRCIYGLSQEKQAPAVFSRTGRRGVPFYALGLCSSLALLAYMGISYNSKVAFGHLVNLVTTLGLLIWISILVTHISFTHARKVQKIPNEALAFKAPFGSFGSWIAVFSCIVISLTRSIHLFDTSDGDRFDYVAFITSYLGIPVYLSLIIGYKVATKCRRVSPKEADLITGKHEFGSCEEEMRREKRERGHWAERILAWIF